MAIAFDASSSFYDGVNRTTTNLSHTCTGSDRYLIVSVTTNATPADNVTGVTYNGTSMTSVTEYQTTNANIRIYHYVLHAPSTGTNTIAVSTTSSTDVDIDAQSYTGVNQASTVDASGTASVAGTTPSISLSSVSDNCWFHAAVRNNASRVSASTGATSRANDGVHNSFDSNTAKTPAGSYTMNFTATGGSTTWMQMIAFAPASGGGGVTTAVFNTLLGVG